MKPLPKPLPFEGEKQCRACGVAKPFSEFSKHPQTVDGRQYDCRPCDRTRVRKWMEDHPERARARARKAQKRWSSRNPEKKRAHNALNHEVRKGRIVPPDACSECGPCQGRIEAHHEDYSKPFDVAWLCVSCHRKRHEAVRT